ncbi:MAG: N-acetylmuramidase family protein [Candidatus Amulumruptor caecigallinarius]|nr:N-acetylmuramidase family protein [Candidatus Amulumruptor caecigallinarius]
MSRRAILLLPLLMWAGAVCAQTAAISPQPADSADNKNEYFGKASEAVKKANARKIADSYHADPELFGIKVPKVSNDDDLSKYTSLSDEDFKIVAEQLGVEIAAIKAVVLIEAGRQMKGFWAPGVPVINFDRAMYNRFRRSASCPGDKNSNVPKGLSGYALQEWTLLANARKTNARAANMGTFWGMFQIGGFNYKHCGCESVDEMVSLMSQSELAQLELFAQFITNSGMLGDLKNKNWAGFARKYNGASYARRGYHTRMANAYLKFKGK